jgi:translation initiation factor 3 subunit D
MVMKQPEGMYVLVKDPNNPMIRLYSVPEDAFDEEEEEELVHHHQQEDDE